MDRVAVLVIVCLVQRERQIVEALSSSGPPPKTEMGKSLALASALKGAQGCWAGWELNFDVRSGRVKPLGSMWLPEDLREWGQPPLGWEIFCRDEIVESSKLKRTVFRVEPESGCAADEIAVSRTAIGIDLDETLVAAPELGSLILLDSRRYPSGETCATLVEAPPFVEARTYFYYMKNKRLRLELKLDPSRATLLNCLVSDEYAIPLDQSPFTIPAKPGSSRVSGFDATTVTKLCGKCFAPSGPGFSSIDCAPDGSTRLVLSDGRITIDLAPNDYKACSLDLHFSSSPPSNSPNDNNNNSPATRAMEREGEEKEEITNLQHAASFSLRREYDPLGNLLNFASSSSSTSTLSTSS